MDGAQGAGPKRPGAVFDTDDLLRFDRVTALHGVRAAPWVVWSLKTVDEENDSYLSSLWLARGDGDAAPVQLTAGTALDNQPRVSPDGAYVAFASDRAGGPPQLHLIRRAGGEARKLTSFREGVLQFGWRPDGRALWVTAEEKHGGKGPNVARRVPYKLDGIGFTADTNCHLHVVELDQPGEPRRLTHGTFEVRDVCWLNEVVCIKRHYSIVFIPGFSISLLKRCNSFLHDLKIRLLI